ncbi:hypothetical protein Ciccas_004613 [Cichlidogyrus casuarinus]|uniref:Uncharacterized protein n=1 Tax=Cichlidogyrus casuarinus TaxID=1844966 RepID=A0ABD2QB11_9PLAT
MKYALSQDTILHCHIQKPVVVVVVAVMCAYGGGGVAKRINGKKEHVVKIEKRTVKCYHI